MSLITRRDEVRALLFLLTSSLEGPVNLVAPDACTNAEFTTLLGRALRRPTLARVPAFALRLVLGTEMAEGTVLASQRVVPRALTEAGFTFESRDAAAVIAASV
jgi:NAD dependent epimerase/dehydratase family enzyme